MIGLRRTVQSLLGYPDEQGRSCKGRFRPIMEITGDAGLRSVAGNFPQLPANVLAAAAVGAELATPPQEPVEMTLYDRGGGAGGLELCTESLGFESCCDGSMDAEEEKRIMERSSPAKDERLRKTARRTTIRKRELPPPLPWLSGGAASSTYLRAEKKDGRLILTKVQIERPEFLRATRHSGRLRLELVRQASSPRPAAEEEQKPQSRRRQAAPPERQMGGGGFGSRCQAAPPQFLAAARFAMTA